jgi:hypothetical protein
MPVRPILAFCVLLGAVAVALTSCGAPLSADLRAEHLSFVETGMFGSIETVGLLPTVFRRYELAGDTLLFGVSSGGDKLLMLVDSHRTPEGSQTPKIYDEIDVTTLDRKVETRIFPAIYMMLPFDAELSPDRQMIAFSG